MVTAINHASLNHNVRVSAKILPLRGKSILVWFSGVCEPTEMKFHLGEARFLLVPGKRTLCMINCGYLGNDTSDDLIWLFCSSPKAT